MLSELFGDVTETVQSPWAKAFLTSALEFFRPHHLALGLRISRLSTTHVEVLVPGNKRSLTDKLELDPGVLTTAAVLGMQLLLRRIDQPDFESFRIAEAHLLRWDDLAGELRGRLEFDKLSQEAFRAELRKTGFSELALEMNFFDEFEKRVASCSLVLLCRSSDQIPWKGKNGYSQDPN